ncbi:DUF2164 domain-containing protein [Paenibacillus sediminis]|uniref:Uncharacterized protein (DUF2164 family) n=1 Tax=Paenibacillus sediminis TaxID=664909 RepID=A0ABS4H2J4_9BACL|nr:DUF2164 domain-containing protein [Paenibacillus sediminis]MBP1936740.1 uncharacterized protein (DUF2164 family) [Paenibacillus sediminis]
MNVAIKPMKLPKEQRDQMIRWIQQYFEEERGDAMGELAADGVLDFFMTHLSPYVYNQAINDARHLVNQRMMSIEEDIYALEQPVKRTR